MSSRRGFASLEEAAQDALAAIAALRGPARESAPAPHAAQQSLRHTPDLEQWRDTLEGISETLAAGGGQVRRRRRCAVTSYIAMRVMPVPQCCCISVLLLMCLFRLIGCQKEPVLMTL